MISAKFEGWISKSNSNGGVTHTPGVRTVFVEVIPADAPQDWSMGPAMVPGQFGAFLNNSVHPRGHSPYAFTTGRTEEGCAATVPGFFKARVTQWDPVEEPEFSWEEV